MARTSIKPVAKKVAVKKTVVKPTVEKPLSFLKEKVEHVIDWNSVPNGTRVEFKLRFSKAIIKGIIIHNSKDNIFYVCSNNPHLNGSKPYTTAGFKFGYSFYKSDDTTVKLNEVGLKDLKFFEKDPKLVIPVQPPKIGNYDPIINPGFVKVGCQKVTNASIRALVKLLID